MDQMLPDRGRQSASNLQTDIQRFDRIEWTFFYILDIRGDGLPVDELHRIEIAIVVRAEMEDRCDVLVAESGRGSGFPQKSLPSDLAIQVGVIDNLQGNRASQV